MEKSIISLMNEVLEEYLSGHIVKFGKEDQEYQKATMDMREVAESFEVIGGIFDFDRPSPMTEQDCGALIEYLRLDRIRDSKALQFAYVLGYRDCIVLQKKYGGAGNLCRKDQTE